jgi:hypothetical protein
MISRHAVCLTTPARHDIFAIEEADLRCAAALPHNSKPLTLRISERRKEAHFMLTITFFVVTEETVWVRLGAAA